MISINSFLLLQVRPHMSGVMLLWWFSFQKHSTLIQSFMNFILLFLDWPFLRALAQGKGLISITPFLLFHVGRHMSEVMLLWGLSFKSVASSYHHSSTLFYCFSTARLILSSDFSSEKRSHHYHALFSSPCRTTYEWGHASVRTFFQKYGTLILSFFNFILLTFDCKTDSFFRF